MTLSTKNVKCAACGSRWATVAESMEHRPEDCTPEREEKFRRMLHLEDRMVSERSLAEFGADYDTRGRGRENFLRVRQDLFALIDGSSPADLRAFGQYRIDTAS